MSNKTRAPDHPIGGGPTPPPDSGWLERAVPLLLTSDADVALARVQDPDGQGWIAARAAWANDAGCARLDHELSLRPRLDGAFALRPTALLRTRDGPVLLYPDGGEVALPALGIPDIGRFLDIATQAATSLAQAHKAGLVHANLGPHALLVHPDGGVRLTAWGRPSLTGSRPPGPHTAPETAGPDGLPVDERGDLYALGMTLFGLLTGRPALSADSPAEWLHTHMAVRPPAPSGLRADTPPILDALLLKLLSKAPEARYQTATALADDLGRCLRDWRQGGRIPAFELARRDRVLRLPTSVALLGRSRELACLRDALRRAHTGPGETLFISGPPGSGKTALVMDFIRRELPVGAISAMGKADQYQQATPYAPITQALRALAKTLVAGAPSELERRRAHLATNLGPQLPLFLHLLPEFRPVMDATGDGHDPSSSCQPEQIQQMSVRALQAFAGPAAPLVLFVDDAQWADAATMALIEHVATTKPTGLLLIVTCRDDDPAVLAQMRVLHSPDGDKPLFLALPPIDEAATATLLATALGEPVARGGALARLLREKSGGNPLHIHQLLRTLVDERGLRYDGEQGLWTWAAGDVARLPGSDTVVDLLLARMARLPARRRDVLRLLACVGGGADEALLFALCGRKDDALRLSLEAAQAGGLLVRRDADVWAFAHDRVQEAAYSLTSAGDRPAQHAAIADTMLALWTQPRPDQLFHIAAQIELAISAPPPTEKAQRYAATLIQAAVHAVEAAARDRALAYLAGAERLLGPSRWQTAYPQAWPAAVLAVECLLAKGDTAAAAVAIDTLFAHARGAIDQAEAHRLKAALLTVTADYQGAALVALDGLRLLGIHLPADPPPEALDAVCRSITRRLAGRPIASLVDLPVMDDARMEATMALLTALEATHFYPAANLLHLHLAMMVDLTLEHGVTAASVQGMAWFGVILAAVFDRYEDGFQFAATALALVDRHGYERYRTPTLVALDQVSPWTRPLAFALARAREAKEAGHRCAERRMLCYSCNHIISDLLAMGAPLAEVRGEAKALLAVAIDAGYDDIIDLVSAQQEYVLALQEGPDHTVGRWEDDPGRKGTPMTCLPFFTHALRGQAALFHRNLRLAAVSLEAAAGTAWSAPGHIAVAEVTFYAALSQTQAHTHTRPHIHTPAQAPLKDTLATVARLRRRLALWAATNPLTFTNKLALVDAEIARLEGDQIEALRLYDKAATAAAAAGFPHEQALAHELSGRHAVSLELACVTRGQMRLAQAAYRRWGALAKVRALEAEFPFLTVEMPQGVPAPRTGMDVLDIDLVLKTARALSEELVLDRLMERLMVNMIIHAGARRGALVLLRADMPRVEATATVVDNAIVVRMDERIAAETVVPPAILHTVLRTHLALASKDGDGGQETRGSFLCQPLSKQGRLVGVLYLENDLASDVFTPRKAAMLEVLAPQAANALEAARLYTDLMEENRRRQETETALRSARADIARVSHLTVMAELAASIAHEINQPLAGIVSSAGAGLRWLNAPTPNLDEALSNLEDIRTAGLRVADILRALRALAKQAPLSLAPLAPDALVGEVLTLTADEITRKGVRLVTRLECGDARVRADRTQLQQVVLNLVTNALDAMAHSTGAAELRVESAATADTVHISVTDTGGGIAPELLERVFDPFFTTKDSGMGMGLAICRSIVSAHNGRLWAEGTANGVRFTFTLPLLPRSTPIQQTSAL